MPETGKHTGRLGRARPWCLALLWLAMLVLVAVATAVLVIAAYRAAAGGG
jgi:uncharacterized membrane protein YhaH (DUF805 family)